MSTNTLGDSGAVKRRASGGAAADEGAGRAHRHRYEGPFWRRLMLAGVQHVPRSVQLLSMPLWAGIFHTLVPSARRAVEANLDRVLGPTHALGRRLRSYRLFVNYAQALTNSYALYLGQELPVDPTFDDEGLAALKAALAGGRGVIMLTGHLGYWSLGPLIMERYGMPVPVMAMAEEPNAASQQFEERVRGAGRVIYTTGSPFATFELAAVLRKGGAIAMQLDRVVGGPRVSLPFCGGEAQFPLGPALIARSMDAPLLLVFLLREGSQGFRVKVETVIEVPRTASRDADATQATERLVRVYEEYVRRYPYQWFQFHDFWQSAASEP